MSSKGMTVKSLALPTMNAVEKMNGFSGSDSFGTDEDESSSPEQRRTRKANMVAPSSSSEDEL